MCIGNKIAKFLYLIYIFNFLYINVLFLYIIVISVLLSWLLFLKSGSAVYIRISLLAII